MKKIFNYYLFQNFRKRDKWYENLSWKVSGKSEKFPKYEPCMHSTESSGNSRRKRNWNESSVYKAELRFNKRAHVLTLKSLFIVSAFCPISVPFLQLQLKMLFHSSYLCGLVA